MRKIKGKKVKNENELSNTSLCVISIYQVLINQHKEKDERQGTPTKTEAEKKQFNRVKKSTFNPRNANDYLFILTHKSYRATPISLFYIVNTSNKTICKCHHQTNNQDTTIPTPLNLGQWAFYTTLKSK